MNYNHRIHPKTHLVKALLVRLAKYSRAMVLPKGDLIVLGYHGTQRRFLKNMEAQIRFFKDQFRIISPDDLMPFFTGGLEKVDRPYLLFSFDDGIKNNLHAVELMAKHGIRGQFFVVPEFINTRPQEQGYYFQKNIRSIINNHIDSNSEDLTPMSWPELQILVKAGHRVGSHTMTHQLKTANSTPSSRYYEIVESKRVIAESLSLETVQVQAFCSPGDSLLSVGSQEMALIRQSYDFHFSTLVGCNCAPRAPYFIKRVNVEAFWMHDTVRFALSNLDRMRSRKKVRAFERIAFAD